MRHIDPRLIEERLPENWAQQAEQAADTIVRTPPESRSSEVNRHSRVWQTLKSTLMSVSHNKCWYCESIDIRSDNAVDHFRPKNAVAECEDHEGYWWLAFEWENYRFCCAFCNSRRIDQATGKNGGKADHFPLKEEARRAKTPADNLEDEDPILLDPFSPDDPGHLWFDENGQVVPSPICGKPSNYPYQRAGESIRLYHLNHPGVVDQRKVLCREIRRRVEEAARYFYKYQSGDGTARGAFAGAIGSLREKISEKSAYSATARSMLMGLRGDHPFVDMILASA